MCTARNVHYEIQPKASVFRKIQGGSLVFLVQTSKAWGGFVVGLSSLLSATKEYDLYGFEEYYDVEDEGHVFDVIEVVL